MNTCYPITSLKQLNVKKKVISLDKFYSDPPCHVLSYNKMKARESLGFLVVCETIFSLLKVMYSWLGSGLLLAGYPTYFLSQISYASYESFHQIFSIYLLYLQPS